MSQIDETNGKQTVNLCRYCNDVLRQANYSIRTIKPGEIKTIRRCGYCGNLAYCGKYELTKGKPNNEKQKSRSEIAAEEIAEEIKDRNL